MLSISDPGKGSTTGAYYFNYYNEDCIEAAEWFGGAAQVLDLKGDVDEARFENLRAGKSPDGTRCFVQNASHPDRDTHWDLTFSAPKSVSILYALGSEKVRAEIVEAHKSAVKKALGYMEQCAAISRRGQGGSIREHCATVAALFTHHASREHDMQLHTHAVLINLGIRPDGSTGSLHSVELFRHKMELGKQYQVELADQLTRRLHLVIETERVSFHVQGVPKELCRENSTRRQQIESVLKDQGLEGAAAAKKIAEETRVSKQVLEKAALFEKWEKKCEAFGWGKEQAAWLIADARKQACESLEKSKAEADKKKEAEQKIDEKKQQQSESNAQKTQKFESQSQQHQAKQQKAAKPKQDIQKQRLKEGRAKIKAFKKDLRKAIDRIYVENQTVDRVMKLAGRLAQKYGVGTDVVVKAVKEARLPKHLGWARVEYRKLFPKAPSWSPLSQARLHVIALTDPARKWGKIEEKAVILKIPHLVQHELRVQQRYLFPGAPKWNPLHKVSFPALRLVVKKAESESKIQSKKEIKKDAQEQRHEH